MLQKPDYQPACRLIRLIRPKWQKMSENELRRPSLNNQPLSAFVYDISIPIEVDFSTLHPYRDNIILSVDPTMASDVGASSCRIPHGRPIGSVSEQLLDTEHCAELVGPRRHRAAGCYCGGTFSAVEHVAQRGID